MNSRALYTTLFQTSPPSTQPANWTRSRIRRRHLVSLGIPVNLDEMLPHSSAKPLPALQITTRPMSAPPGPRNASNPRIDRIASPPLGGASSASNSRAATPVQGRSPLARNGAAFAPQVGLGPKPALDEAQIERMLAFSQGTLSDPVFAHCLTHFSFAFLQTILLYFHYLPSNRISHHSVV
jgi:hypothetical protein